VRRLLECDSRGSLCANPVSVRDYGLQMGEISPGGIIPGGISPDGRTLRFQVAQRYKSSKEASITQIYKISYTAYPLLELCTWFWFCKYCKLGGISADGRAFPQSHQEYRFQQNGNNPTLFKRICKCTHQSSDTASNQSLHPRFPSPSIQNERVQWLDGAAKDSSKPCRHLLKIEHSLKQTHHH
jgi:hypothetical protein